MGHKFSTHISTSGCSLVYEVPGNSTIKDLQERLKECGRPMTTINIEYWPLYYEPTSEHDRGLVDYTIERPDLFGLSHAKYIPAKTASLMSEEVESLIQFLCIRNDIGPFTDDDASIEEREMFKTGERQYIFYYGGIAIEKGYCGDLIVQFRGWLTDRIVKYNNSDDPFLKDALNPNRRPMIR
jgi:hypothetical protein